MRFHQCNAEIHEMVGGLGVVLLSCGLIFGAFGFSVTRENHACETIGDLRLHDLCFRFCDGRCSWRVPEHSWGNGKLMVLGCVCLLIGVLTVVNPAINRVKYWTDQACRFIWVGAGWGILMSCLPYYNTSCYSTHPDLYRGILCVANSTRPEEQECREACGYTLAIDSKPEETMMVATFVGWFIITGVALIAFGVIIYEIERAHRKPPAETAEPEAKAAPEPEPGAEPTPVKSESEP